MERRSLRSNFDISILLLPGLLIFGTFTVYPIFKLLVMSFFEWDFGSMFTHTFIGAGNYSEVISDPRFRVSFVNTLAYTALTVPAQMAIGLFVAMLIHGISRFRIAFRVLYYLPVITSWVIASLVFRYIFNTEGLLNHLLVNTLKVAGRNIRWLDTRWGGLSVAMALGVWKGIGWNMVVFLAALQGIPAELYEAAEMDGAGGLRRFSAVTIPCIRGTILFALVMLTIGGFNVFTSIKLITNGQPAHGTETVLTWMYFKAFSTGHFGYSAALSFIVAATLGVLAYYQFKLVRSAGGD